MEHHPVTDRRQVEEIIATLRGMYPEAPLELHFTHAFELLIAVILSAQCKDERVNMVTARLFTACRTPEDILRMSESQLEEMIRPTGYYRQKAKTLRRCAEVLRNRFGGTVPRTIEELIEIPGVGRKTAAMVLGNAYGIEEGIAVDRHVERVVRRLGISTATTPEKIERELMALVPRNLWTWLSNAMILHGRRRCTAQKPRCPDCALRQLCTFWREQAALSSPPRGTYH